jgi:hypothetical protein
LNLFLRRRHGVRLQQRVKILDRHGDHARKARAAQRCARRRLCSERTALRHRSSQLIRTARIFQMSERHYPVQRLLRELSRPRHNHLPLPNSHRLHSRRLQRNHRLQLSRHLVRNHPQAHALHLIRVRRIRGPLAPADREAAASSPIFSAVPARRVPISPPSAN